MLLGAATTTLSTALNFGPSHAFAWTTEQALQALAIGAGAALLLSLVPRRVAAGFHLADIAVEDAHEGIGVRMRRRRLDGDELVAADPGAAVSDRRRP